MPSKFKGSGTFETTGLIANELIITRSSSSRGYQQLTPYDHLGILPEPPKGKIVMENSKLSERHDFLARLNHQKNLVIFHQHQSRRQQD